MFPAVVLHLCASVPPPQTVPVMASVQPLPYFALSSLRLRLDGGAGWVYDKMPQGEARQACCPPLPTPREFPWDSEARCVSLVEQEVTVSLDQGGFPQPLPVQFCDQTHWQRHAGRWHWEPSHMGLGIQCPVGTD